MKIIISISGGGIRGIIPAIILEEIEKRTKIRISNCCDLIAGNSTGGIIACLLTIPDNNGNVKYSASQISDFYSTYGKEIFKSNVVRTLWTLNGLIRTKYSSKPLERLLKNYCGEYRLNQCFTDVIIPAYQVTRQPQPYFFKSSYAKKAISANDNPYIWECARATSAASSYFSPYKYYGNAFIDGGIFANNPSVCAYAEGKKMWGYHEQIVLISLGTGQSLKPLDYNVIKNWGILQWAIPYFQQTSISADDAIDYILRTFTNANRDIYYRFQTNLDKESLKMDDTSNENMDRLKEYAQRLIHEKSKALDEICEMLKASYKINHSVLL